MAVFDLQASRRHANAATISGAIAMNVSTSVLLKAANTERIFLEINNDNSNQGAWVKLQATSEDNDQKGIFIGAKSSWTMPSNAIYTGEICGIADADNPDLYVTEY